MSSNPTLTKRRHMTVYKYTQVRKYTHVPADFLLQMKSWFEQQHFKIKRNHRGHGHLSGRRDGIHINFVPKFLLSVKNFADHSEVTFSYAARIRKIGIATAVLTEGLSVIIGAVTLTAHVAQARGFVDVVTDVMDSISGKPFEIVWQEATEAPGAETNRTTTTTTRVVAPAPAPVPVPVITPASPPRTPRRPIPAIPISPVMERISEPPLQPQIIVVPQSTFVVQPPSYYGANGMNGINGMNGVNGMFDSNNNVPQIAYQPPSIPIGEPIMPTMFERPTMLTSTRYPMPSSMPVSTTSAPAAAPLAVEYPMQSQPLVTPSSFSLTEPMFPQQKKEPWMSNNSSTPYAAYGSARN